MSILSMLWVRLAPESNMISLGYISGMTKFAQFIDVKTTFLMEEYAKLYLKEIVSLHEIPLYIILDEGSQVTSHF